MYVVYQLIFKDFPIYWGGEIVHYEVCTYYTIPYI